MARIAVPESKQIYMNPALKPFVEAFIEEHNLPQEYFRTVEHWFLPMVDECLINISSHTGTFIIGVSGSQGSGKSTLAELIVLILKQMLGLRVINLSMDDFYLTLKERQALAKTVHPLLATRGVPGTHDIRLAMDTMTSLSQSGSVEVPRFDKARDDRCPVSEWPVIMGPVDVIVLEGWCLSIDAQESDALSVAINELEATEDPDCSWRNYVNEAIKTDYRQLYSLIDYLVMLKAPNFDKVYEWRQTQEDKLRSKFPEKECDADQGRHIMCSDELKRFVQHYERITRHGLETLPEKADVVFHLTEEQTIDKRL